MRDEIPKDLSAEPQPIIKSCDGEKQRRGARRRKRGVGVMRSERKEVSESQETEWMEEEEKTYISRCDEQVQRRRRGRPTQGSDQEKDVFVQFGDSSRCQTSEALDGCMARPVIRVELIHLSSPCVGCNVDYSLRGRWRDRGERERESKRNHSAEAPTTGSNHLASTAAPTAPPNAQPCWRRSTSSQIMQHLWIVMASNCWLCRCAPHACLRSCRILVFG